MTSGAFKKGDDPRRHMGGSSPAAAKKARRNKMERFIDSLQGDAPAIAQILGEVIKTAMLPSGRELTGNEWSKIVVEYNDRVLGKALDPNKQHEPIQVGTFSTSEMIQKLGGREHLEKLVNG